MLDDTFVLNDNNTFLFFSFNQIFIIYLKFLLFKCKWEKMFSTKFHNLTTDLGWEQIMHSNFYFVYVKRVNKVLKIYFSKIFIYFQLYIFKSKLRFSKMYFHNCLLIFEIFYCFLKIYFRKSVKSCVNLWR